MLAQLNRMLERRLPLIAPVCVLSGITFLSFLHVYAFLVPWIFACMTFASSLGLKVNDINRSLRNPLPIFVCLIILQVIMPILAFGVGGLFFPNNIDILTGIVLAFIIPTGVISLMWVSMQKGNTVVTLTIILVNTLLSPFIVPFSLSILLGAEVSLDTFGLMKGLFWMIVVPSVLAILVSHFYKKPAEKMKATLSPFSKISLLAVIIINSSVVSPYFNQIDLQLIKLMVILVALAIIGYSLGIVFAKLFKWNNEIAVSLAYSCGLRNNGVGGSTCDNLFRTASNAANNRGNFIPTIAGGSNE